MKKLRSAAAAAGFTAALLCTRPLDAQISADSLPPLEDVVEAFMRHDATGRLPTYLVGVCPSTNPYGDRLMLRLMAEEQTPRLVAYMASMWRMAMRRCGDEGFGAWFRARLMETQYWNVVRVLTEGLLQHPTHQNIAAVKAFVVLQRFSDNSPVPERYTFAV
jgi:hypothetical protein